jgi:hypothetical protein
MASSSRMRIAEQSHDLGEQRNAQLCSEKETWSPQGDLVSVICRLILEVPYIRDRQRMQSLLPLLIITGSNFAWL